MDEEKRRAMISMYANRSVGNVAHGGAMDEFNSDVEFQPDIRPAGTKRKRASPHPSSSTMRRAALVSKIMRERGMTLTEASSHVKGAGLTW